MNKICQFIEKILQKTPLRQLLSFWENLTASWRIYLEKPLSIQELKQSREAASIPSFGFFFLLVSATVLATLGLLANSTAVIIGAMIIAPLMNPILSMSFSIVTGNWTLYRRSIVTVFLGTLLTILVSYWIALLLPINVVGSEILGRTSPTLLDLVVAIAAGAAGSFALTRKSIGSSIAGVAIAVALVPPLCVVGIGIGIGENLAVDIGIIAINDINVPEGAFLLFLANLAGITFTACLIFLSQSYGNLSKAFQTLIIWFLIMVLLTGPLSSPLQEFFLSNRLAFELHNIRNEQPDIWQKIQIRTINTSLDGTTAYVTIWLIAPKNSLTDEYLQDFETRLFKVISSQKVRALDLNIRIIPVAIREYQSIQSIVK